MAGLLLALTAVFMLPDVENGMRACESVDAFELSIYL
jgi:hypothetical protein